MGGREAQHEAETPMVDPREAAYSVVLTSCGRFDLLAQTVGSLVEHTRDAPPAAFIVVEDSGDAAVREALARGPQPACGFLVLLNRPQVGQMRAIDRAYGAVATPLIFHCEDDWLFTRPGFIAESRAILAARPGVSMVGLRPRAELNPLVRDLPGETLENGVAFFAYDPGLHPEYFSYSFNPGLRRTAEARALQPFAGLGREEDVSFAFKKRGFRMASLEAPACRHLGEGRHVLDPTSRAKPTTLLGRVRRSAAKRVKRLKRALGAPG